MIKKVLCLTLIFALTISCVSTGAQANSEVSENHGVLEELKTNDVRVFGFMEALVPFFENPAEWRVQTISEVDISNSLYMDAIEAYRNGNYQKIYEKWGSIVKYVDYLPIEIETSDNQTNGI